MYFESYVFRSAVMIYLCHQCPHMHKYSNKLGNVSARFQRDFGEVMATLLFSKFKLNVNSNENESINASGGACAMGTKRPRVGVLTRCVFAFVFV